MSQHYQHYRLPKRRVLVATLQGPRDSRDLVAIVFASDSEYAQTEFVQLAVRELGLVKNADLRTYAELTPILDRRDLNLWTRMAVDLRLGLPLAHDGGEVVYGRSRDPSVRQRLDSYAHSRGLTLSPQTFVAATQSVDGDTVTVIGNVPQRMTTRLMPATDPPAESALRLDMSLFHQLMSQIARYEDGNDDVELDPPAAVVCELGNDVYGVMFEDDTENVCVEVVSASWFPPR